MPLHVQKKFKKRRVTSIPRKDSNDVAMSTVFYDPLGLDVCLRSSSKCSDGSVIFFMTKVYLETRLRVSHYLCLRFGIF